MSRFSTGRSVCVLVVLFIAGCRSAETESVFVFSAASLTDVMEVLADSFATETGYRVQLNLAASSILARQIEYGAGADVFVSASDGWAQVVAAASGSPARRLPITTRLVLVQQGAPARLPATLDRGAVPSHLALGDPSHVPAGQYAQRYLECMDLWHVFKPRIVPTVDVRAALAAVQSGAADAAIVYETDVPNVNEHGLVSTALSEACQPPIEYFAVVVTAAGSEFADFIADAARANTWHEAGFVLR